MNKYDDLVANVLQVNVTGEAPVGDMLSHRRVPVISLAAAFCTDCRLCIDSSVMA